MKKMITKVLFKLLGAGVVEVAVVAVVEDVAGSVGLVTLLQNMVEKYGGMPRSITDAAPQENVLAKNIAIILGDKKDIGDQRYENRQKELLLRKLEDAGYDVYEDENKQNKTRNVTKSGKVMKLLN